MSAPSAEDIAAAQMLLARLGVTPHDLLATSTAVAPPPVPAPTFAEYIPVMRESISNLNTRRTYDSHWNQLLARPQWRDRRLDEPTVSEFRLLIDECRAQRHIRRSDRGGFSTTTSFIKALRCLYRAAVDDGLIDERDNTALELQYPPTRPGKRQPLCNNLLARINLVAATTGIDPELDALLIRLHTETACRVGGALALRPQDLDVQWSQVWLREKRRSERWQPVSPTLARALADFAHKRGVPPGGQLLVSRRGRPITRDRYTQLWARVGRHVPEVEQRQITTHWLRHTTLRWVERNCGYSVAMAFAGHALHTGYGTTLVYTKADITEVAYALELLTGEPHPLAQEVTRPAIPTPT